MLLLSLVSAAAFAPVARVARASSLRMGYEKELGAQAPLGFFDPLNYLKDAPKETFDAYRYAELKHGRIAQLAILGHLVTSAGFRWPNEIAPGIPFSSIPAGLKAFSVIPLAGTAQLFAFIGLLEWGYSIREAEMEKAHLDAAKSKFKWTDKTIETKKAIELNNGRAAQMGILGLVTHELINNDPFVLNRILGAPVAFNAGF